MLQATGEALLLPERLPRHLEVEVQACQVLAYHAPSERTDPKLLTHRHRDLRVDKSRGLAPGHCGRQMTLRGVYRSKKKGGGGLNARTEILVKSLKELSSALGVWCGSTEQY